MSAGSKFASRTLSASEYIRALFGPADNVAVFVLNRGTGEKFQRIARAAIVAGSPFQEWLATHNTSGADVFVGMNPVKAGVCRRTKGSILEIRHVYLDLDRNGDASLATIRNSREVPEPNFILATSPGKHQVVWKVTGFTQNDAEFLLHSLAIRFDGDLAATDSTRVLRLPGFANRKLAEEFVVQARQGSNAVYTGGDFKIDEHSPEASLPFRKPQARRRTDPSYHKSQSEKDWAYAKRALARGDDLELVVQRIADYRADDKTDPNYYARHTVMKARVALNSVVAKTRVERGSKREQIPDAPER